MINCIPKDFNIIEIINCCIRITMKSICYFNIKIFKLAICTKTKNQKILKMNFSDKTFVFNTKQQRHVRRNQWIIFFGLIHVIDKNHCQINKIKKKIQCYNSSMIKTVDTSIFYKLTNHSYTNHLKNNYIKNNNIFNYFIIQLSCYLIILLSSYPNVLNNYK